MDATNDLFWLRAHVTALTQTVHASEDRVQAILLALNEVCPEFQEAFERHLVAVQKLRAEQAAVDIDMRLPLTNQPLGAICKKFLEGSK